MAKYKCNKCEHQFDKNHSLEATICPKCGSDEITAYMSFSDNLETNLKDCIKEKVIDSSLPSKKKIRKEVFVGANKRVSDNKWMYKERIIDRDNDYYKEKVVDPEEDKTIHYCEELLSDHFGHGSDKKNKGEN